MSLTTMKVTTAGRAQIPIDIRKKMKIEAGDTLIVEIRNIIKVVQGEDEHRQKQEVTA